MKYLRYKVHYGLFGLLLYGLLPVLLTPTQTDWLTDATWQLSQHHRPPSSTPAGACWTFHPNGQFTIAHTTGSWQLRGKTLALRGATLALDFRIATLSKEELVLETRLAKTCLTLHFSPSTPIP